MVFVFSFCKKIKREGNQAQTEFCSCWSGLTGQLITRVVHIRAMRFYGRGTKTLHKNIVSILWSPFQPNSEIHISGQWKLFFVYPPLKEHIFFTKTDLSRTLAYLRRKQAQPLLVPVNVILMPKWSNLQFDWRAAPSTAAVTTSQACVQRRRRGNIVSGSAQTRQWDRINTQQKQ